jgi:hypothetical protein
LSGIALRIASRNWLFPFSAFLADEHDSLRLLQLRRAADGDGAADFVKGLR